MHFMLLFFPVLHESLEVLAALMATAQSNAAGVVTFWHHTP
jgi:hypothetical protein